ncbi:hypothetical protein T492DRAFT_874836 [Pavlovales sp. CCMP2436]|nr:hypothetical protein T492DRAFT_874836 [Pavlovales sp. CCMP2436]
MFGLGTMAAMSLFTAASLDRPDFPAKMTVFSSGLACVVGTVWTFKALSALPAGTLAGLISTVARGAARLLARA